MSWKVRRNNDSIVWYLLPTSTCKIGRQGCQIVVPDTTVSRHHANIDVSPSGVLTLSDVSKFVQTSVNGTLLTPTNRTVVLKHCDVLNFGAATDSFTVEYDPFILVSASLESDTDHSSGVVFQSSLTTLAKGLLVDELIDHSSDIVLDALLSGIPLVSPSFLSAMLRCPSGSTSLPSVADHRAPFPRPEVSRQTLFRNMQFFITEGGIRDKVRAAGGVVITSVESPMGDLFIVNDANSQPVFDFKIERAKFVSSELIRKAILDGSVLGLERTQSEDIQPRRPEVSTTGTGWISTQTKSENWNPNPCRTNTEVARVGEYEAGSGKKFKKSRIAVNESIVVPLQDWRIGSSLQPRVSGNLILNRQADELDEWMRRTNSQ